MDLIHDCDKTGPCLFSKLPGNSKAEARIARLAELGIALRVVDGPREVALRRAPQDPQVIIPTACVRRFHEAGAPRVIQPLHDAPRKPESCPMRHEPERRA